MLPIIKTDRTKAMEWWNSLSASETRKYRWQGPNDVLHIVNLSGKEIQGIWEMLNKPSK